MLGRQQLETKYLMHRYTCAPCHSSTAAARRRKRVLHVRGRPKVNVVIVVLGHSIYSSVVRKKMSVFIGANPEVKSRTRGPHFYEEEGPYVFVFLDPPPDGSSFDTTLKHIQAVVMPDGDIKWEGKLFNDPIEFIATAQAHMAKAVVERVPRWTDALFLYYPSDGKVHSVTTAGYAPSEINSLYELACAAKDFEMEDSVNETLRVKFKAKAMKSRNPDNRKNETKTKLTDDERKMFTAVLNDLRASARSILGKVLPELGKSVMFEGERIENICLTDSVTNKLKGVGGSYQLLKVYANARPRSNDNESQITIIPIFEMHIGKKVISTASNGCHRVDHNA